LASFSSQQAFAGIGSHWILKDDATGGDCTGNFSGNGPIPSATWNAASKTCTLNQDHPDSMGIEIPDEGITLDGNDHSISPPVQYSCSNEGSVPFDGVLVEDSFVTVKNLEVFDFYNGIKVSEGSSSVIKDNDSHDNCNYGIKVKDSSKVSVTNNFARFNEDHGIFFRNTDDSTLSGNNANTNGFFCEEEDEDEGGGEKEVCDFADGINLERSEGNTVSGNNANGNTDDGIELNSSDSNTVKGNTANSNVDEGFDLEDADKNTLTSNTANGNEDGFDLEEDSDSNTLKNNTENAIPKTNPK